MNTCVYVLPKNEERSHRCQDIKNAAFRHLNIETGDVNFFKIFEFQNYNLNDEERNFVEHFLVDSVVYKLSFSQRYSDSKFASYCVVSKKEGITDDESRCAEKTFEDRFSKTSPVVSTHTLYMFEKTLPEEDFERLASTLLGNPLIENFTFSRDSICGPFERSGSTLLNPISQRGIGLSKVEPLLLSLNDEEIGVIKNYFSQENVLQIRSEKNLKEITDCEWEILGQTWSEHCKHKEFNAEIEFTDLDTGEVRNINSLFHSKIKRATEDIDAVFKAKGNSFLVKVFNDNAGVVRVDDENLFVWKVETHNTPSALDPYGGAMTGVLGVNRDAFGTGVGGARLLFNTNVLCFGKPDYVKALLKGQKHPLYIREGVVKGIRDAGNQSGVPTVNGAVIYDDRYSGKPLVYCGTGGLLPHSYGNLKAWDKYVEPGDKILMLGGRVGKDGIHGATASSTHTDETTPTTIVQIGSPLTQKLLSDYLEFLTRRGLVKSCTDNGAGGLSSSIGELASLAGGARVYLEKVPLKYPGLAPWEIFVSESQERMTLVCNDSQYKEVLTFASTFEVEATVIGEFTNSGFLEVSYEEETLAYLSLDFLHDGVPKKKLLAEWKKPDLKEPSFDTSTQDLDYYNETLLKLLASPNICSRRKIIQQYDHEVKGRTVLKPLMGKNQNAPQDAAVLRLSYDHYRGIAVSNGIIPRYGDIDAYEMSANSFDEALRQIIAVGGELPDPEVKDPVFWSVNDNFCVPNIVYDPVSNPDGKLKLAKLVRMCDALYDMSTFFCIPMTSGKDSMKNDFGVGKDKISVPPTILYSMVSGIRDVRATLSSEWKEAGDLIYHIGQCYEELGASEYYALFGYIGAKVPRVRKEQAKRVYTRFSKAHKAGLLQSAHDISDGGLLVALAESCIGSELGARICFLDSSLSSQAAFFSESPSRFIVSVSRKNKSFFEDLMQEDAQILGEVTKEEFLHCEWNSQLFVHTSLTHMAGAWEGSWYA